MWDRGMGQQILLIESAELRHGGDDASRIFGLPCALEHLVRLLQQRALTPERACLPEVKEVFLGLEGPLTHVGYTGDGERQFSQRTGRCGEPRHERSVQLL